MDPLDDAFNTIRNTLNDLRKRVAALERAQQPAAQQKAPADDMPGAVEYYLEWFAKVEDLDGLATAFEQFWRNGRAGLEAADVERVTAAKDKRKHELTKEAA